MLHVSLGDGFKRLALMQYEKVTARYNADVMYKVLTFTTHLEGIYAPACKASSAYCAGSCYE